MQLPDGWAEDTDRNTLRYDRERDPKAGGFLDRVELTCYQDSIYIVMEEEASMVSDNVCCGVRIPLSVLERAYKRVLELAKKNTP